MALLSDELQFTRPQVLTLTAGLLQLAFGWFDVFGLDPNYHVIQVGVGALGVAVQVLGVAFSPDGQLIATAAGAEQSGARLSTLLSGLRVGEVMSAPAVCGYASETVESVLAAAAQSGDVALVLDSNLVVEGEDCSISFLLVPDQGGVDQLLARLGLA